MNHCYRLVFNKSTQVWQVVSEIAKSHSKSAAVVLLPLLGLFNQSYAWAEPAANALPTGGQVVSGQSAITQNGNQLNIVQGSQKSIINWQSYNIGSNAEVNYVQNNSSSISLNRVITGDPSAIFGKLNATGQVWLINPNGVLFGKGAQVNVGGLLASTLNIADDDFMSGQYQFTGSSGSVVNMGAITASQGGYVVMLAPEVRNEGVISAMQGTVAFAAGNAVTLDFNGNGLINVQVDSASVNTLVENKHLIKVGGGQVLMSTKAADGLITSVINNSGKIEANSMVNDGGVIRLTGAKTVINSGEISATSSSKKGGTVHLLGDNVGMFNSGSVNVSGKTGGGTILVGGDYQGKNANIQNATKTFVGKDAKLIADAIDSGDGGKVIVWADDITRYYGSTSAKGGAFSGNGGFVEISGKRLLNFLGNVDLSAVNGIGGNLLLDPANITISNGLDTNTLGFTALANADIDEAFADDANMNSVFDITATTGSFAGVSAGSTITLQATNDITIANDFIVATATGSANNSLVLEANNNINVNAALTLDGTGALTLRADADNNGSGNLAIGAAIATDIGGANLYGVNVTSTAAGSVNTTGASNANGGNVNIVATDSINLAGSITALGGTATTGNSGRNAGNVSLTAGKSIIASVVNASGTAGLGTNQNGGHGGAVSLTANTGISAATLFANGSNATGNGNAGNAGSLIIQNNDSASQAAGDISISGNIVVRAGTAPGTGTGGAAGSVVISNQANTGSVNTSLVTLAGNTGSNGGNLTINSEAAVMVSSTIDTTAGAAFAGAGKHAGNVTITGANRTVSGAITANGSAGVGTNQAGGNAGIVSITGTGSLDVSTIDARTGAATGTGASGLIGGINLTGSNIMAGAITTAGQANGNGGTISATASGILALNGAISSSGGAPNTGAAGANAGAISFSGNSINASSVTITAIGTNASGADQVGGNGAAITLNASGNISTRDIIATGGSASATNAKGGDAGSISIATSAGNITTNGFGLDARTGAGAGTGANSAAGFININNTSASGTITTGSLNTSGNANGAGGNVSVIGNGAVTVGTVTTTAGGTTGTRAGLNAGNVTISGLNRTVDAVTANGGSGAGTNQAGGNAGAVSITGIGTLNVAAINARTGAATGTGAGGLVGSVNLTGSDITTADITTAGQTNGNGGTISATASGLLTLNAAITSAGGAANSGSTGRNAGAITLSGNIINTTTTINANGSNGSGANQDGGNAAAIMFNAVGNISTSTITANGGDGAVGNAKGGNAGSVSITTSTGNLSTDDLMVRTGLGSGTGANSLEGYITISNNSVAGTINVSAVDTRGQANGHGGSLTITGNNAVNINGSIRANAAVTTGNRIGGNGGNVSITGGSISTGTINTTATAGSGASQSGGQSGYVSINATLGEIEVGNITAEGGNGDDANGNGGNGGNVMLNAATGSTILIQNINTTGGNRLGTGTAGMGGNITIADNALLAANSILTSTGGSAGVGAGGTINFNGTVNSNGAARTLTINSNGTTTFAGAVGNTSALSAITTDATGATIVNGGSVSTTGAQAYSDAVTLGAATTFTTTNSNINFASSINANGNNVLVAAGTGTFTANNAANNFGNLAVTASSANVRDANAIVLGATNVTGAYTLQTAGNVTQTAAVIVGAAATFNAGATGDITLNTATNNFNSVAVSSARNVSLVDSDALTVNASTVNSITARTLTGNLTLGGNIAASGTGDAITLASAANFLNPGNSTLSTPSGRWLVYANTHTGNTFGGLISGNQAIYNRSFPTATSETGNRYIFANSPSLSVTSTNQSKTYGQDAAATVANAFTATTFVDAAAFGGVFTQDTIANSLTGSAISLGSATTANAGSYAINVTPITSTNGYALTKSNAGNLTVNAAVVNIAGSRVYDGTTVFNAGAFSTFATGVNGETLNVIGSGGSVTSKNAGAAQTLTTGSLALANGSGLAINYTLTGGAHTGTITAATLNLNAVADSKVYDGNTSSLATVATSGLVGGDTVTGLTQSFASRNVLAPGGSTLNVDTGYTVNDGNSGNNYTVVTDTATGTITAATLNLNAVADSKVYDGNTSSLATVATSGLVGGDTVTGLTQSFASRNVLGAGNSTLNVDTGYTVNDGNSGNNYTVNANTATGTITAATLNLNAVTDSKVYDGNTSSLATVATSGLVGGDTVTGLSQSFASRNVLGAGNSTLNVDAGYTVNDGNSGNNYTVVTDTAAGTITAANLSITTNNATKTQGSVNPVFTSTISGFVGGDTSAVFAGTLDYNTLADTTSPIGTYTVTPLGVTADNYFISFIDGMLEVTSPAPTDNNISTFNNATTRPEQAFQTCNSQSDGQAMINGLDEFGADDVDYQPSIGQPQVGGVIANGLAGVSCSTL